MDSEILIKKLYAEYNSNGGCDRDRGKAKKIQWRKTIKNRIIFNFNFSQTRCIFNFYFAFSPRSLIIACTPANVYFFQFICDDTPVSYLIEIVGDCNVKGKIVKTFHFVCRKQRKFRYSAEWWKKNERWPFPFSKNVWIRLKMDWH